ncbi:MAG: ABC transporter permease [Phycisphaerales bacterium]
MPSLETTAHPDEAPAAAPASWRAGDAGADWWRGTRRAEAWSTLAWFDVILRYRRSMLGPWWITLSLGLLLAGLAPLYSILLDVPLRTYLPFVTLGVILWTFIAGSLQDCCNGLVGSGPQLRLGTVPPSLLVWRIVARHAFQFAHHLLLVAVVLAWSAAPLTPVMLLALPGLLAMALLLHFGGLVLAVACARFRDVASVVSSVLQLAMFLTPVFWEPSRLPDRARFVLWNPFAAMIETVRAPMLGEMPHAHAWMIVGISLVASAAAALAVLIAQRGRLVYWV